MQDATVLDVGAADGNGMRIMRELGAAFVSGIDLLPLTSEVDCYDIQNIPPASYDVVTAMDVIEHVEEDLNFIDDMVRIAKFNVFFSTPNWNKSRCKNQYHVREYTPKELIDIVREFKTRFFLANDGWEIVECKLLKEDEQSSNFGVLIEL